MKIKDKDLQDGNSNNILVINYDENYEYGINKMILFENYLSCLEVEFFQMNIFKYFYVGRLPNEIKIKVLEIINNNWEKVDFENGKKYVDILIDGDIFFRILNNEKIYFYPNIKIINWDIQKFNCYDVWIDDKLFIKFT